MRALHWFLGTAAVLAGCFFFLQSDPGLGPGDSSKPRIVVLCAAGLKGPLESIARSFESDTGIAVELDFGGSQTLFARLSDPHRPADVFLPADESYIRIAREKALVGGGTALVSMQAVVIVRKPASPPTWADLTSGRLRVAQADPSVAAVGRRTQEALAPADWRALNAATTVYKPTVSDVLNAVRLGGVDAGVVWDAIVLPHPDLLAVHLPQLAGVTARVEAAVAVKGPNPHATERFVRYLADPTRGGAAFRTAGYAIAGPATAR
ncbi:MAG TPA: molybdate ABC transporter substrate-binding protein [Fimbriiglobus sp.]|jgi:molybdate transport system substrate-binding protein